VETLCNTDNHRRSTVPVFPRRFKVFPTQGNGPDSGGRRRYSTALRERPCSYLYQVRSNLLRVVQILSI